MSLDPAAPSLQKIWDWRAVGNFIGGGTGTGFLLLACLALLLGAPAALPTLIGLAFVAGGLVLVWLEIGRPLRALHVFFHPQTSWMTREAMVSVPLMLIGLAAAWLQWRVLAVLLAAVALVFLYCQGRILRAARGIPAWRHPRVVPLIVVTGLTEGAAMFVALTPLLAPAAFASAGTAALTILTAMAIARYAFWRAYLAGLRGEAPLEALRALRRADPVMIALGTVVPAVAAPAALLGAGDTTQLAVAAGLCGAAGGWYLKGVIIARAAYNQGFALVHSPARGGGKPGPGIKPGW